jgi:hypothetical protein
MELRAMDVFHFGDRYRLALLVALTLVGCDHDNPPVHTVQGDVERISISGSSVVVGFQAGKLRMPTKVADFAITPEPVTLSQYAACRKAGACPALQASSGADASNTDATDAADADATDVADEVARGITIEGASSFCSWVGGSLPTLPQWLLAARGSSPQRFAWGEHMPTCAEHPRGLNVRATAAANVRDEAVARTRAAAAYEPCGSSVSSRFAVNQHPAGTSGHGLKDVLLTSSELLAKDSDSIFGSCRGKTGTCEVFGSVPGAIDFVREADTSDSSTAKHSSSFGFRCVWSGGGEP